MRGKDAWVITTNGTYYHSHPTKSKKYFNSLLRKNKTGAIITLEVDWRVGQESICFYKDCLKGEVIPCPELRETAGEEFYFAYWAKNSHGI